MPQEATSQSTSGTVEDRSGVGRFECNTVTDSWWWSDALYHVYGYEPGAVEPSMNTFLQHKDPRDRARIDVVLDRCVSEGGPFSCYHRIIDAHGRQKMVVVVGFGERDDSDTKTVRMHGFMVDVSSVTREEVNAAMGSALKNRAGIEQVKGAIMMVYGLDADAAFAVLRGHSQVYNIKLTAIVAAVLSAFQERGTAEAVTRGELDRMLWDAAHQSVSDPAS